MLNAARKGSKDEHNFVFQSFSDLPDPDTDSVLGRDEAVGGLMLRNAWQEIRRHPSRITALVLAILISIGFMVTTVVFFSTETRSVTESLTARIADSDVIVEAPAADPAAAADTLSAVPGVDHVETSYEHWVKASAGSRITSLNLYSVPSDERLLWVELTAGSWPGNPDEVVIGTETAESLEVTLGDMVTVSYWDTASGKEVPRELTVSGVAATSTSLLSGEAEPAFGTAPLMTELGSQSSYLVIGDASLSGTELADRLQAALDDSGFGQDATVLTKAEYEAAAVETLTDTANAFRNLLLSFSAIALVVGCIVIANTFAILIAQRRRQIGLLRTVGAEAGQVRRGLLAEAALVGLIGSVLGIGLGIGVGAIAAAVSGSLATGLDVPVGWLLAALAVGVSAPVLAAVLPTRRAMRIAPLEVLRPVSDARGMRRATWTKVVVAAGLLLTGTILVGAGLVAVEDGSALVLLLAIAGSALLVVGLLVVAPFFIPPLLRGLGRIIAPLGPTVRLATNNTVRNPGRAAATCTALMLAIGMIVTLQVGSASIRTTLTDVITERYPVDLTVARVDAGALDVAVQGQVAGLDRVAGTRTVPGTTVSWTGPSDEDPATESLVYGLDPSDHSVVRGGLEDLDDDRVLMNPATAMMLEIESGAVITVEHEGVRKELRLWLSPLAQSTDLVVSSTTLSELDSAAPDLALWAAVSDRDRARAVVDDVRSELDANTYSVSGSLAESAMVTDALDIMLEVATGLLAVAAVIALIGVGNTLGLSVIERTRESALLRALGLQRARLRLMLAIEAVQLALVGALVGILAGVLFGWIATMAIAKVMEVETVHFAVSVPQTLAMIGVALAAGLVASVLPARRAAMAAPTEALAEV